MTPEYRTWLIEMFAPLGEISVRRVFGYNGLYLGDAMFGLVAAERIYLKTNEASRQAFEHEGSTALTYTTGDGELHVTSYWEIPGVLYDEPEKLVRWARLAHEVALNSSTAKRRQTRAIKQTRIGPPVRKQSKP